MDRYRRTMTREAEIDEGGDAACWAHLVCESCGQVTEPGTPHRCEGSGDGDPALSTD